MVGYDAPLSSKHPLQHSPDAKSHLLLEHYADQTERKPPSTTSTAPFIYPNRSLANATRAMSSG